ncbi:MAG: PrgI family protein [Acidipropionibacterium jensenii]|uniref:PrgI family protein n=1 Tax=Acidipropionibacterium jensenii TaxID=1749 RepID=UPI0026482FA8|nr:PrgI family protein [Acidipropionibacterium jensenii]MDN6794719.1 PrgI family protein [Propionibacterium sp.]MDN6481247.1 PrgI family protein [Acidipropionibacterium jensenii]MDN6513743.1 PrgI family protein [Acidipropionibacterium jensenii]MDN6593018.1 PrgI family protein [Acidipropionibacterium jensenii]MDN6660070.1 PrgI family protein [Acidipropionibacterium jensenii]
MAKFHAKVYKNIGDFRPKLFFGMTGRQLALVIPLGLVTIIWSLLGVAVDPGYIGWVARWWPGVRAIPVGLAGFPVSEWGQFVVIAVVIVVAWFGWGRPMGMKPEIVLAAALRYFQHSSRVVLKMGDDNVSDHESARGRHLSETRGDSWSRPVVKVDRTQEGPGEEEQGPDREDDPGQPGPGASQPEHPPVRVSA